jgi:hypothetical protein
MRIAQAFLSRITFQTLAVWLLVLALAVRAVVPLGMMPDFDQAKRGVYTLKICTGYGSKNVILDRSSGAPTSDHKNQKAGGFVCPFAGLHALALPILLVFGVLLSLARQARRRFDDVEATIIRIGATYPRGPPLFCA